MNIQTFVYNSLRFSVTVLFGMGTLLSTTWASGPSGEGQQVDYKTRLQQTNQLMRELNATIDRSAFEFESLIDSLDYDSEEIVSFVKEQVAFEQYQGTLRGPLGTLYSRAGNALDQSLLLGKLLKDAGYDARIAAATLSSDDAKAVLGAMKQPLAPLPAFGDSDAIVNVLLEHGLIDGGLTSEQRSELARSLSHGPDIQDSATIKDVQNASAEIFEALDHANVKLSSEKINATLLQEAQQYHWVQYQTGAGNNWIDAHPIFNDAAAFETPTPESFIQDSVPESLQHRFRFQVFIERKIGDRLESVPVTAAWERPVANLVDMPLTFSNLSDSMSGEDLFSESLDSHLNNSTMFIPTFGSDIAPGGQYFDLSGNLIDPMVASQPAAGVFKEVNKGFSSAIGQLGGESAVPALTAQWIDFTLIAPGGKETVFRRTTFDRIGPAARSSGNVPAALSITKPTDVASVLRRHTFFVSGSDIPRGLVIDSAARRLENSMPAFYAALGADEGESASLSGKSLSDVPTSWSGSLALSALLGTAERLSTSHRIYRPAPALLLHSDGLDSDQKWTEIIDIVSNPRRAIDIAKELPSQDMAIAAQAGIWETHVEGNPIPEGNRQSNAGNVLLDYQQSNIRLSVTAPGRTFENTNYPDDVIAEIESDLQSGLVVLAAQNPPSTDKIAWWTFNPESGETLGKIPGGYGGDMTEFLITSTISLGCYAYGMYGCSGIENEAARGCCYAGNTVMLAVGFAFGLGQIWSATAGALWDVGGLVAPVGDWCQRANP